jgi:hypothetical protein
MAFGDWDHIVRTFFGADLSAGLELGNAIVGNGSLKWGNFDGGTRFDQAGSSHLNNTFTRGLTKGRLRTLVQREDVTVDNNAGYGFYFMCDNLDPTNNSSDFYWFGMNFTSGTGVKPIISKHVGDTMNAGQMLWGPGQADVLIESASEIAQLQGDILPFQVEWNLDITAFGGVRITASAGLVGDTNFSNLAVLYDIIDSSSPLTSSLIEGFGNVWPTGAPGISDGEHLLIDSTGVFQLV